MTEWFVDKSKEPPISEDEDFKVLDQNRDQDTGELLSFLVVEDGEPVPKKASPENVLLYVHGLKEFFAGEHSVIVSEEDPEVIIAPTENEVSYLLRVNGSTVETTPSQASDLLEGLKDVVESENSMQRDAAIDSIVSVYDKIISSQVRRWLVRAMITTFDRTEQDRIEEHSRGWLIDGFYVVDWKANLYTVDDDPEEKDYEVSGSSAQKVDKSYEFLRLTPGKSPEPMAVQVNGDSYRLSEREMLFLSKVRFMLDRRYYHPDTPFWKWTDNYAGIGDS